jgi:hypothetical protein
MAMANAALQRTLYRWHGSAENYSRQMNLWRRQFLSSESQVKEIALP